MTAEVAVLNRIGVALAADSAVTVGANADKIFSSADKLFSLSHSAPVGVMIYGAAALMGMPWETIIKAYRNDLGSRTPSSLPKLVDYMEDMKSFLAQQVTIFDETIQRRACNQLLTVFMRHLVETARTELDAEIERRERRAARAPTDAECRAVVAKAVERRLKQLSTMKHAPGSTEEARRKIKEKYSKDAEEIFRVTFGNLPLPNDLPERIRASAIDAILKPDFSPGRSGLVIAGFGDDEYFPSAVSIEIDGVFEGVLRYVPKANTAIGDRNGASVMPFAQSDMVNVFMEGIEPTLKTQLLESVQRMLGGISDQLKKHPQVGSNELFIEKFKDLMKDVAKGYTHEFNRHIRDMFVDPVLGVVASLPKEELGATAEALVNLTKFRRRATNVRETVGGPIDVALITKGDGFIWVRRKHYFDPALNPRAMARFQKEGQV